MKRTWANWPEIPGAGRWRGGPGLVLGLALLACCGCGRGPSDASESASDEGAQQPPVAERQTWDIVYMKGSRVGYQHTKITPLERDGRQLVRVQTRSHLVTRRDGQRTEMEDRLTCLETADGALVEFDVESSRGPEPMRAAGRVAGNTLQIERSTKGKTETASIPWSPRGGGFAAVELSLARKPMKPGEERTVRALVPELYLPGTNRLVAREVEPVRLLEGTRDLLRIDTVLAFPEELGVPALEGSLWTDESGEVIKSWMATMNVESYRATREEALKEIEPGGLDLVADVKVPVDRQIPSPRATKRIRYRVQLGDRDPADVFVAGPSQKVESIDPHTAEVTVYALRPDGEPGNPDAPDDPPTDDDLQPNNLIQSDFPAIVAAARKVAPGEQDPWRVAVALERYAADAVTEWDYTQAFATAADVIASGKGDCTEHAVLLAALCRARGVPARLAIGLVYAKRAFYYHMWTEVYLAGQWIALDATRPQGGIGAAHLKMAHSNFKKASALSAFLPVMQVIGKLEIEVVEVE